MAADKILLMGRSGAGKTSMRSIIFADYAAGEAWKLGPTMEMDRSELRFLNNAKLSLWDCSGSEEKMRMYVEEQAEAIFSNVCCLIYVFDVHNRFTEVDLSQYESILECLRTHSPDAALYTLLHKADMLPGDRQAQLIKERRQEVEKRALPSLSHTFATSIWDESLYKAWSSIVHALLLDVKRIELKLAAVCEDIRADEMVLFEPHTLLLLAQAVRHGHHDHHRWEKISNIVKQFRMACLGKRVAPLKFSIRTGNVLVVLEKVSEDLVVLVTGRHGHLHEKRLTSLAQLVVF